MMSATRVALIAMTMATACVSNNDDAEQWRGWDTEEVLDPSDDTAPAHDLGAGPSSTPAVDAYPESGECGYARAIYGESNGHVVYGEPVLEQNNCAAGSVCGRPTLDSCTDQQAEHFTCGCQPTASSCDAAALGALLASPDYHLREDATRRAKDCCVQLEYPGWVDGLGGAVNRLEPPSLEAGTRFEAISAACVPRCTGKLSFEPYPGDLALESQYGGSYDCAVVKPCRGGYREKMKVTGDSPYNFTCPCTCEAPPAK